MEAADKYMNIVYQDSKVEVTEDRHPGHPLLITLKFPEGFRKPDFEVLYVPSQNCLVIRGDLPVGGNTLRRFYHKIELRKYEEYQGEAATASFKGTALTLKLPCKKKQIDQGETEPPSSAPLALTPRTPQSVQQVEPAAHSDDHEPSWPLRPAPISSSPFPSTAQFATNWLPKKRWEKRSWLANQEITMVGHLDQSP